MRSVGPTAVHSRTASAGSFPRSRLTSVADRRSATPATGTPRWAAPRRPPSWTVVARPGSSTSRQGPSAARSRCPPVAGRHPGTGRRHRRRPRTGRGRRAPPASAAAPRGSNRISAVRPSRCQPPGVDAWIDGGEPPGHRHRAGRHRGPGRGPPGKCRELGGQAGQVGESGGEPDEGHLQHGLDQQLDHAVGRHANRSGHVREVVAVEHHREDVLTGRGRGAAGGDPRCTPESHAATTAGIAPLGVRIEHDEDAGEPDDHVVDRPRSLTVRHEGREVGGEGVGGRHVDRLDQDGAVTEGDHPSRPDRRHGNGPEAARFTPCRRTER